MKKNNIDTTEIYWMCFLYINIEISQAVVEIQRKSSSFQEAFSTYKMWMFFIRIDGIVSMFISTCFYFDIHIRNYEL
jgi:hypothetical protein